MKKNNYVFGIVFTISTFCVSCDKNDNPVVDTPTTPSVEIPEKPLMCPDGNHPHQIDLGLSSGTKWSCCNLGANQPAGYGSYFAWGEASPKSDYTDLTYQHATCTEENVIYKYLGDDIASTIYDAAHARWGGAWQMCSLEDIHELLALQQEYMTLDGVAGFKYTGPNGRSIFLPAAGRMNSTEVSGQGHTLYYWTSTYNAGGYFSGKLGYAWAIIYHQWTGSWKQQDLHSYPYYGYSIRPVVHK